MVVQKGFTLIELAIVVVIIGVIAAFAIPSYTEYTIRTNRTDMQTEMVRISQDLQRYQMVKRTFDGATLGKVSASQNFPAGKPLYTLTFELKKANARTNIESNEMPKGWVLKAEPIATGKQKGNGTICLNSKGEKYWNKGETVVDCTSKLSATSKWDGK